MAKNFGECARDGGKVVTKRSKDGQAIKVCYDSDGKTHYKNNNNNNKNRNKSKPKNFGPASLDSISNLAEHFKQLSNK